jgi:15-cis-phytoene synthase
MTLEPRAAPVREFVLRFAPAAQRASLDALFEIEREVAAAATDGLEHSVAHAKLGWWDEELARLLQAQPRHPATRRAAAAALASGRTPPDLRRLVEVARVDLARVAFLDRSELDRYLDDWAVALFRPLALSALGASDARTAATERYAAVTGPAVREIELLSAVIAHARAGRVFVPLGDPPRAHERWYSEPLAEAETAELRVRLTELRAVICRAAQALPLETREPLAAALVWASLALRTARLTEKALPRRLVANRTEPLRRTIAAWQAAVSACRGHLPRPIRTLERA